MRTCAHAYYDVRTKGGPIVELLMSLKPGLAQKSKGLPPRGVTSRGVQTLESFICEVLDLQIRSRSRFPRNSQFTK